jgi:putative DNA primase/helicase
MNKEERIAQARTEFDDCDRGAAGRKAVGGPGAAEFQSANVLLVDLNKQLAKDVNIAFSKDFLEAAAVLYEQGDAQPYHGLYRRLKEKCIRVSEWERRVREVVAKRKAAREEEATRAIERQKRIILELKDREPWNQPVVLEDLLEQLVVTLKRFLVLPALAAETLALWVVHTYVLEAAEATPRLALLSPQKRCGKTKVLDLLFQLVQRPLATSNVTAAALFRTIDACRPTALIDEVDTFGKDNAELRGVLNSGHTRASAWVIRNGGDHSGPRRFSTWCPVAYAAIGRLPDTWMDRSIVVRMRRKKASEEVERFTRKAKAAPVFDQLARKAARWAQDSIDRLKGAEPELLATLDDRAQDSWEPLLAIADLAGTRWSLLARDAARILSGAQAQDEVDNFGVIVLRDLRSLFEQVRKLELSSAKIVAALVALEDRPWAEYGRARKPLSKHQLASLLRPFEIHSLDVGPVTARLKGYRQKDCQDAFERYLGGPGFFVPELDSAGRTAQARNRNGARGLHRRTQSVGQSAQSAAQGDHRAHPLAGATPHGT